MSIISDTQYVSTQVSEVDRLEMAEDEDALEQETEEHPPNKLTTIKSIGESLLVGRSNCAKFWIHTGRRCRYHCLGIQSFMSVKLGHAIQSIFLMSGSPFMNRGSIRSAAGVAQERVKHISTHPFMIHPFSLFRWCWELCMILAFSIILIVAPIQSAFYPEDYTDHPQLRPFKFSTILFLDMLLNMRTGEVQSKTDIINMDGRRVFSSYLKRWLLIDLVSSIPFDDLYLFLVHYHKIDPADRVALDCARIFVFTRFFLLIRLVRYLKRVELNFKLNGLEIRLLNIVVMILTFLHWFACSHFLIPHVLKEERMKSSWLTKMDLWNKSRLTIYTTCFMRSVSHFTLMGFGYGSPVELGEILLSLANIVCGCVFIVATLGYVLTFLMSLDVSERRFIEVTKQAEEYMRFKQIPPSLQARVEHYYQQYYRRRFFSENIVLSSVSSALRRELRMQTCQTLVEEVPLFHSVSRTIIQEIVSRLEFEVYLPNDVIIWAGTVGECMYFIEHGSVSILAPTGYPICTLHDGDFLGEMSLVFNEPRVATVVAATYCDIYKLDKGDFMEVVQPYPEIYESIVKVAEGRMSRLDKQMLYKHAQTPDLEKKS